MSNIRDNISSGQLRSEAYEHLKIATDLFKKSMDLESYLYSNRSTDAGIAAINPSTRAYSVLENDILHTFKSFVHAGASVLQVLMENPGHFLTHEELYLKTRYGRGSKQKIPIYIHKFRKEFKLHGISPDVIETGYKSYSLTAEGAALIREAVEKSRIQR